MATRLLNGYVDRVLTAAEYDISVLEQFMKVAWLVDSPVKLMRPQIVRRAVMTRRRQRHRERVTELSPTGYE